MKQYVCGTMIFLFCLSASQGFATTLLRINDNELMARAHYVVAGHVEKIDTKLEKNNTPFQYITIKVTNVYKQNDNDPLLQNEEFTIRQIGGQAFGMTLSVDGLPKFVENENVMLCLEKDSRGSFYVIGNAQGMYHIVNDKLINDTTQDSTMFARRGENGEIVFSKGEVRETSISDIKAKIEKAAIEEGALR